MAALARSYLNDLLPISAVKWDIQRNDQFDGDGSGDVWQAELADPLWLADVTLDRDEHDLLKKVAARIRALNGAAQAFLLCDPLSLYPQADPAGTILGSATVTVGAVNANRSLLSLAGLPGGYILTDGDKVQITQGTTIRFHEVSAGETASGGGAMDVAIWPRLSLNLAAGAAVTLKRPACPVIILPGSHDPGTGRGTMTEGAAFRAIQKKRA